MKARGHNEDAQREIIHVLIVEQDAMVAAINRQFAETTKGYCVLACVANGAEALAFLEQHPVDLVILALLLPGAGGLTVLQEIRHRSMPVDVIAITGADDVDTVSQVLRQGVIAYLAKPFEFSRFLTVLEAYREFWLKLRRQSRLTQQDIDGICGVAKAKISALPKNFNHQTMLLILKHLAERGEAVSADEAADGVGLSRTTARRYLEYCQETGRVERVIQYLAVGRPVHRFCLPQRQYEEGKFRGAQVETSAMPTRTCIAL